VGRSSPGGRGLLFLIACGLVSEDDNIIFIKPRLWAAKSLELAELRSGPARRLSDMLNRATQPALGVQCIVVQCSAVQCNA
jgi:hypothetical protein